MKYRFSGFIYTAILATMLACQSNNTDQQKKEATATQEANMAHQQTPEAATTPSPTAVKEAAKQIPPFKFYKVKSGVGFSLEDIPDGRNTVFILFDPSCGHCQHETSLLAKNYAKLTDVNLYFVSMNDPALMASFLETFGKELVDKPNVEVLYDKNQEFIQKFHVPQQFPANYVYGADRQLKTYWDGEKEIDFVLSALTKK